MSLRKCIHVDEFQTIYNIHKILENIPKVRNYWFISKKGAFLSFSFVLKSIFGLDITQSINLETILVKSLFSQTFVQ